jgi:preprotein translocase subunit SecA
MQSIIKEDFTRYVFHAEIVSDDARRRREPARMRQERRQIPMAQAQPVAASGDGAADEVEPPVVQQAKSEKIPRNAPCPCGSGKKYKLCHGRPGAVGL